jgi:hypothetical protein
MKLTKLLLAAIVFGIAVPSLTSCYKNRYKICPVKKERTKTTDTTKTPVRPPKP